MTDALLRRVCPGVWQGTLNGYEVQVSSAGGWHFAIAHPKGYVLVAPRCQGLRDGARKAREWVEAHPLEEAPWASNTTS